MRTAGEIREHFAKALPHRSGGRFKSAGMELGNRVESHPGSYRIVSVVYVGHIMNLTKVSVVHRANAADICRCRY